MKLHFDIQHKIFHLHNKHVSYIMQILKNGHLGQLYFGKRVPAESDYSYLLEMLPRAMTSCVFPEDRLFSLEHLRQEYPVYGSTDYRQPALEVLHPDGSLITDLVYQGIVAIPKITRMRRMAENLAIFDFTLGEPGMQRMAALAQ